MTIESPKNKEPLTPEGCKSFEPLNIDKYLEETSKNQKFIKSKLEQLTQPEKSSNHHEQEEEEFGYHC